MYKCSFFCPKKCACTVSTSKLKALLTHRDIPHYQRYGKMFHRGWIIRICSIFSRLDERLWSVAVRQITERVSQSAAGTFLSQWLTGWRSDRARFERARLLSAGEASRRLKRASEWRRRRADVMKMNGGSPAPRRASCWADRWWTAATCNTNHSDSNTTSAQWETSDFIKTVSTQLHFTFTLLLWVKKVFHDAF